MVVVAQLVRAPGCGPGGRGFESRLPPHFFADTEARFGVPPFFCALKTSFSAQKRRSASRYRSCGGKPPPARLLRLVCGCRKCSALPARRRSAPACGPGGRGFGLSEGGGWFSAASAAESLQNPRCGGIFITCCIPETRTFHHGGKVRDEAERCDVGAGIDRRVCV